MFKKLWYKYLGGTNKPWADIEYTPQGIKVLDYNKKFLSNLSMEYGSISSGLSEKELISVFEGRDNIKHEEPYLDVKHSGITEDGRIKIELDWNKAFIKQLADNGIYGNTDEEAIQMYLSLITQDVTSEEKPLSEENIREAFKEIETTYENEINELRKELKYK